MPHTIEPGSITRCSVDGLPVDYFVYLPARRHGEGRVFVTIHGISRNAEEHLRGFAAQAEIYGVVMIAPLFTEKNFKRYQRLGATIHEGRADLAFDRLLQDAEERLDIETTPLRLFGFSGGGQFAQRYAMFYPRRVARMVLGAPGWYTFPDPNRYYPLGLRSSQGWPKLKFSPAKFLQIPTLVLVGEEDILRDEDLNKMRRVDAFQGFNRMERGERWVNAMRALARSYDVPNDFRLENIPNASHAYESYLGHPSFVKQIFEFLFDSHL